MLQLFKKFATESHRLRSIGKFGGTAVVLTGLGLLTLVPVPGQNPADAGTEPGAGKVPQTEAGYLGHSGGFVRGKRARTQTAVTAVPETAVGVWFNLPGGNVPWTIPAGTTDLFNVAFAAECGLSATGSSLDYVRIRIVDVVGGAIVGVFEPNDGNQSFCSVGTAETHKGNWVRRANPGVHTIQVQFQIQDNAPLAAVTALIDDWILEVVVYD